MRWRQLLTGALLLGIGAGGGAVPVMRRAAGGAPVSVHTVAVGTGPLAVVVDAATGRAFVLTRANTVAVIDTRRAIVLRTVPVPGAIAPDYAPSPQLLTLDARTGRVFVLRPFAHAMTALDARTGAVVGHTPLAPNPVLVAVDTTQGRVFVVSGDRGRVDILDARTGHRQRTVALPDLHQATGVSSAISDASPPSPTAMAVDERTSRLFIVTSSPTDHYGTNLGHGSLTVIDTQRGAILCTTSQGVFPRTLTVDVTSGHVFVADDRPTDSTTPPPGDVTMRDVRTGARLGMVHVGNTTSALATDGATGHLFVLDPGTPGIVRVLDTRSGQVRATVRVGDNPVALAIDALSARVDVANQDGASVSMLDARVGTVLHTVGVGQGPDAIAVDAGTGRVVVANGSGNNVSLIDAPAQG